MPEMHDVIGQGARVLVGRRGFGAIQATLLGEAVKRRQLDDEASIMPSWQHNAPYLSLVR